MNPDSRPKWSKKMDMQQLIYHLVEKRTHARNEELFELKKGKQIKDQENRLSSPWIKFEQGKSQPVLWKLLINIYIVIFLYRLFFLYSVGIPNGNLQNLWRHLMNYGSLFNSYWWIRLERFRGKNQQKKKEPRFRLKVWNHLDPQICFIC